MSKHRKPITKYDIRQRLISRSLWAILVIEIIFVSALLLYFYVILPRPRQASVAPVTKTQVKKEVKTGKIVSEEPARVFSASEVQKIISQTNKRFDDTVNTEVTKQTFVFTTSDGTKDDVPIYARVYLPSGNNKKPIFAFAPGTSGIADSCSASLEDPAKKDWSNYDSLVMAYASQGFAVVAIDYEGMRDSSRLHHFMVGELQGKALLDSVRAVSGLAITKDQLDDGKVFSAGYSEGGQAAYWADQIKDDYAPELNLSGAIGFGPVTSVEETLDDATRGANTNWFGPLVLASYSDWYKASYPIDKILLSRWAKSYLQDAQSGCIDGFNKTWPNNIGTNRSDQLYTSEFIKAAKDLNIAINPAYAGFSADMAKNIVGSVNTARPKLINQGINDNVILLSQSQHGFERMCVQSNIVTFKKYDTSPYAIASTNPTGSVGHEQTMNASFKDTLAWMQNIISQKSVPNSCK